MTFTARLTELLEKATKEDTGPWVVGKKDQYWPMYIGIDAPPHYQSIQLVYRMEDEQRAFGAERADLIAYLVNHAEAIRDLVVAAEQEHGGNHHEPECPICVALAKFNDAGEK